MWVVCKSDFYGLYYQSIESREADMKSFANGYYDWNMVNDFISEKGKVIKHFPTEQECKNYIISIHESNKLINVALRND
jgi:hypothetical protein